MTEDFDDDIDATPTPLDDLDGAERVPRLVRAARTVAGFASVRALANALAADGVDGLGAATLRAIEQGRRRASAGELRAIARACKLEEAFFYRDFKDDTLSDRIRTTREMRGVSRDEVAKTIALLHEQKTGEPIAHETWLDKVRQWEAPDGEGVARPPDDEQLGLLATALDVSEITLRGATVEARLDRIIRTQLGSQLQEAHEEIEQLTTDRDRYRKMAEDAVGLAKAADERLRATELWGEADMMRASLLLAEARIVDIDSRIRHGELVARLLRRRRDKQKLEEHQQILHWIRDKWVAQKQSLVAQLSEMRESLRDANRLLDLGPLDDPSQVDLPPLLALVMSDDGRSVVILDDEEVRPPLPDQELLDLHEEAAERTRRDQRRAAPHAPSRRGAGRRREAG